MTANFRYQEILTSIVRAYIETGEPVVSRTISKRRNNAEPGLDPQRDGRPADEGYLSQPHTSAGRMPTEKAFRFFVRRLVDRPPDRRRTDRVRRAASASTPWPSGWSVPATSWWSATRNVGIAAAIPALAQELDQIELVPLADRRVVMMLVTRDHMVRNRVVTLDEAI